MPATHLGRILRDLDISTAIPLVLFLRLEADLSAVELKACYATLESFVIRRAFNGDETREYNKLFVEIVGALRNKKGAAVPPALEAKLLSGGGTTRAWPTDEQIVERALNGAVYDHQRQPMLRLILERLEQRLRGKKSEQVEIPTGMQIEHVMPVSWSTHWPILGETVSSFHASFPYVLELEKPELAAAISTRNQAVHSLGNLTLLNEYLNPAASNGTFELKRAEYGHSVLRLNRYFDSQVGWSEAEIRKRGRILAEMINAIWPRPKALGEAIRD